MPVDTLTLPTLEVIQTQLLFGVTKTIFYWPTTESHSQQLAQVPAIAAADSVGEKILHISGQNAFGHDQRALPADEIAIVSLSPTSAVTNFPDVRSLVRVLDPVGLRVLLVKDRRVASEVFHLAGFLIAPAQARCAKWPADAFFPCFSDHFGFRKPDMGLRWDFDHISFATLVQAITSIPFALARSIRSKASCGLILKETSSGTFFFGAARPQPSLWADTTGHRSDN